VASIWRSLRYFSREEFGVDAGRMDHALLRGLDAWRAALGRPVHVNESFALQGHVADRQHGLGRAVDCWAAAVPFGEAWLAAEAEPAFTGLGLYPWWTPPGFHLDTRDGPRVRWWRDQAGLYHALDIEAVRALVRLGHL
jgi:hypothetical protein